MQEYALENPTAAKKGGPGHSAEILSMPTRTELRAAGRGDLVHAIIAAGGFLAVAQVVRRTICNPCCRTQTLETDCPDWKHRWAL